MKKLFQFKHVSEGIQIEGLFVADTDDLLKAMGSSVSTKGMTVTLDRSQFKVVSEFPPLVDSLAVNAKNGTIAGDNPLELLATAKALSAVGSSGISSFIAYTDGACKGNPGPGGWGVSLRNGDNAVLQETCGGERMTTNNAMELTAAIKAVQAIPEGAKLLVYTDSQYVKKGMSEWITGWKAKGWKTSTKEPVKNEALWKALDEACSKRKVTFEWVRGHNGDPGNERADVLSNEGIPR